MITTNVGGGRVGPRPPPPRLAVYVTQIASWVGASRARRGTPDALQAQAQGIRTVSGAGDRRDELGFDCRIDGPTGAVAAVAFAVVLYKVVRSPAVSSALSSIINSALHAI